MKILKKKKIIKLLKKRGIEINTKKSMAFIQQEKNIYVFSGMIGKEELEKMKREINIKRIGILLMYDDEINKSSVDMLKDKIK